MKWFYIFECNFAVLQVKHNFFVKIQGVIFLVKSSSNSEFEAKGQPDNGKFYSIRRKYTFKRRFRKFRRSSQGYNLQREMGYWHFWVLYFKTVPKGKCFDFFFFIAFIPLSIELYIGKCNENFWNMFQEPSVVLESKDETEKILIDFFHSVRVGKDGNLMPKRNTADMYRTYVKGYIFKKTGLDISSPTNFPKFCEYYKGYCKTLKAQGRGDTR